MNSVFYNALRKAGVGDKEAPAVAIKAVRSDIYFREVSERLTLQETRVVAVDAKMDQSSADLIGKIVGSIILLLVSIIVDRLLS